MPDGGLDVMREWFEQWNRGDLDAFAGLFAAEAEVITDPSWMEAGPFRGRDAIRQWFEGLKESWDAEKLVVGELFEADDKVVAHFNWEVHGRTSGIATKLDVTSLNTITDGQIVRQQYFFDHAEALKAVGLEE